MSETLMRKLLSCASKSNKEVVLIAPFIKYDVIKELFNSIPSPVNVRLVTRWFPNEVYAGVSDLEVFDLVENRANTQIFVHPLLHAKFYRFDEKILMGSANLTRKALGWASPSNIELLYDIPDTISEFNQFEIELFKNSMLVDKAYREKMERQVQEIVANPPSHLYFHEVEKPQCPRFWLPSSRNPDRLWKVYLHGESAQRSMVESAYDAALADLSALEIEPNLNFDQFKSSLSATLEQMPLVHEINNKARLGLSTQDAIRIIEEATKLTVLPLEPHDMWEILRAWLEYFFPNRYRRETSNEIFRLGSTIN